MRQFVLFLVFSMLVAAAARVFPTMSESAVACAEHLSALGPDTCTEPGQHNVRSTLAFLEAPDPEWQACSLSKVWTALFRC